MEVAAPLTFNTLPHSDTVISLPSGLTTLKTRWLLRKNQSLLCELLRPHIEGQTTAMRSPVSAVNKVARTRYYLADERKYSNMKSLRLSRQVASETESEACEAVTDLGSVYIQLLQAEELGACVEIFK